MRQSRLRLPSPAMAVALLALFVALTGGAYAAATIGAGDIEKNAVRSKHIKAKQVKIGDLGAMARFRRATGVQPEQTALRLAGLEITYACSFTPGIGSSASLAAKTTAPDAYVNLGFITGADGFGSSFVVSTPISTPAKASISTGGAPSDGAPCSIRGRTESSSTSPTDSTTWAPPAGRTGWQPAARTQPVSAGRPRAHQSLHEPA